MVFRKKRSKKEIIKKESPKNEIKWRKRALERLSSPDQIDQLMEVVPPMGWLALLGFLSIVMVIVIWAFFGSLPNKVSGKCVAITEKGIYSVESPIGGTVQEVLVRSGDKVKAGQLLIVIHDPVTRQEMDWLLDRLDSKDLSNKERRSLIDQLEQILSKREECKILSPIAGTVLEVPTDIGQYLAPNELILSLQPNLGPNDPLYFYAYVPVENGTQIQPGMTAEIMISGVDSGKYGCLLGEVQSVAVFPVSLKEVAYFLKRPVLARYLTNDQPVRQVVIKPLKNPKNPDQFLWSAGISPDAVIAPGVTGSTQVIVKKRPPISYLIPSFSNDKK